MSPAPQIKSKIPSYYKTGSMKSFSHNYKRPFSLFFADSAQLIIPQGNMEKRMEFSMRGGYRRFIAPFSRVVQHLTQRYFIVTFAQWKLCNGTTKSFLLIETDALKLLINSRLLPTVNYFTVVFASDTALWNRMLGRRRDCCWSVKFWGGDTRTWFSSP